nr:hypothetical protein [Tanacetum cinerariifolium]
MVALVVDMKEDLAMLFGDDDFSDDDFEGFMDDEEVGGPSTVAVEGHFFTLPTLGFPVPPSVIKDLCTRMGNLEYRNGQLMKKVIQLSDVEVADGIAIKEIIPRASAIEGQVQTLQAAVQQRDMKIQQLQTMVTEMRSREGTLMQCILGMDRHLADLERRLSGPQ